MRPVSYSTVNPQGWMQEAARAINHLAQKRINVLTKTAAYTLEDGDDVLLCDATAAPFTVTLPSAATFEGREFVIKKIDASANAVTIDGNASETIDGALTASLASQWAFIRIVSDGTNWQKV